MTEEVVPEEKEYLLPQSKEQTKWLIATTRHVSLTVSRTISSGNLCRTLLTEDNRPELLNVRYEEEEDDEEPELAFFVAELGGVFDM